jgi:uncharacterized glyoxalase superfamily protein PhnB
MTENSNSPAALFAYFGYRDAVAAIDWLGRAFGFETTTSFAGEDGSIAHAELRLGDAAIVVFSDVDGYQRPPRVGDTMGHGTYIAVSGEADVKRIYAQAVEAGATVIWEPGTTEWGNFRCRVVDPEGFEWTFGTHRPGLPASW